MWLAELRVPVSAELVQVFHLLYLALAVLLIVSGCCHPDEEGGSYPHRMLGIFNFFFGRFFHLTCELGTF